MSDEAPVPCRALFLSYLDSGELTDFTITCREYQWRVHRLVLAASSAYFDRLIRGPSTEATEGAVDLSEEDPEILAHLIVMMYVPVPGATFLDERPDIEIERQGSLDKLLNRSYGKLLNLPKEDVGASTFVMHAALVAAAETFLLHNVYIDSVKAAYASDLEEEPEGNASEEFLTDFLASVRFIYQSPPAAGLRGMAIIGALRRMAELQHREDFRQLLREIPQFAIDMVKRGLQRALWCTHCLRYLSFYDCATQSSTQDDMRNVYDCVACGKQQDCGVLTCKFCKRKGTCVDVEQGRIAHDA